jgi:hypothetical protein
MNMHLKASTLILSIVLSSFSTQPYADEQEITGNYEFGKTIAQTAYGRGCLGCHSIDKFKDSSTKELMNRIINSWHIAGFTEEDVRDLSKYLAIEAN